MTELYSNIGANLLSNGIWIGLGLTLSILIFLIANGRKLFLLQVRLWQHGLISFFPTRDHYTRDRPLSLEKYLETAEYSLIYAGHWLAGSTQRDTLVALKKLLLLKKKVTLVLLSASLKEDVRQAYANFFGTDAANIKKDIESSWKLVSEWTNSLGSDEREHLTVKAHSEFIGHSAFGFDFGQKTTKVLIDQKLWGMERKNSYGFEFIKSKKDTTENSLLSRYQTSITKLSNNAAIQLN